MPVRIILAALLFACLALASNFRLYMADGSFHTVSEYKVEQDRVRYYSTERSDWEELPLSLVDLKRTEAERTQVVEESKKAAAADDAEEQYEREQELERSRIPMNAGVYVIDGSKVNPVKQAESKIVINKKRLLLTKVSPIPLFAGKATIEVDGAHSAVVFTEERPTFWFRLSTYERFGIVRCTSKKDSRVVEIWNIISVAKEQEVIEDRDEIDVFRQQVGDDLYKIWPQKPLEPGEYAVVEYTQGQRNTQIWDFRIEKKRE